MKNTLDQINLEELYAKANDSFQYCIALEDNEFLNEEINIAVSQIKTKNDWIRMQFFGSDKEHYIIEIRLSLFTPSNKNIGYYCLHENEDQEHVDDYLVFD